MPSHPPRRWADEYPNQGPPPLNDLVKHHKVKVGTNRDFDKARCTAYSLEHQYDPNPQQRFDEFVDGMRDAYGDSPKRPFMAGQAHDTGTYHTSYGVSAPRVPPPPPRTHPAQAARDAVISGRLAAIKPHFLYTGIRRVGTKNVVGACCEYLSLQPYMVETQGTLRTIRAVACEIETGIRRAFCPNCRQFATNAVNQFFGLRIIDESSGLVYQSAQTAAAYAAAESQQQQQQQAIQHSAVQPNYVAQQMFQLPPPQQTVPTVVQYYHPNQASQALPVAGPSNSGRSASKKKPKSGKTVVQY